MAEIRNKNAGKPETDESSHLTDKDTGMKHGVPAGAAGEESHGGYGGTDRLQSEVAPIHPEAGKDQAKDI